MSENPVPQEPGARSSKQDIPVSAHIPDEPSSTPPEKPSKLDWRLTAIVGIAVLFLIAAYINKKWYSKPKPETPPAKAQESGRQTTTEPAPSLTPAQMYARGLQRLEMESESRMYTAGGRTLIVGAPPLPIGNSASKEVERIMPGVLFDVTNMAEGLKPEMLHCREAFGTGQKAIMDAPFLPLGLFSDVQMVVKPASDVTMDVVQDRQPVVGVKVGAEARAYPLRLMNYHDVINDTLGGEPILVTWSAVANAATASSRKLADGTTLSFGSAGWMFQDAIVLYSKDVRGEAGHEVESYSLWSTTQRLCIAGERVNARLPQPIRTELVSWQTWKAMNPNTTVLTGTNPVRPFNYDDNLAAPRDYMNANAGIPDLVYGLDVTSTPMSVKHPVYGVTGPDGHAVKAYAMGLLLEKVAIAEKGEKADKSEKSEKADESGKAEKVEKSEKPARKVTFEDTIGGRAVTLTLDADHGTFSAKDADGKPLLTEAMLWIAWFGAHPKTEVWQEERLRAAQQGMKTAGAPAGTAAAAATTPAPATSASAATSASEAITPVSPATTSSSAATGQ